MNKLPSYLNSDFLFRICKYILCTSLLCLFIALGTYKNIYPFLYISACSSLVCIVLTWKNFCYPKLPYVFFLPIALSCYALISPGGFLQDARLGSLFLASYFSGVGAILFFHTRLYILPLCLLGVISASFITWVIWQPENFLLGGERLQLFYSNPNVLAPFCAWGLIFLFSTWKDTPNICTPISIMCVLSATIACALTSSRSTFIGFSFIAIFCAFYLFRKHTFKICIVSCLLAICLFIILPEKQQDRVVSAITNPLQDPTFQSRMPLWLGAFEGFKQSPWVGLSHKNFRSFNDAYRTQHYSELKEKYPTIESHSILYPHSMGLWLLFSWGIVGTTLALISFGATTLVAVRTKNSFFLLTLIFFLGFGLFDSPLHNKTSILILFTQGTVSGFLLRDILQKTPESKQYKPC